MSRAKLVHFSFTIPITQIKKEGTRFGTVLAGELVVYGTGKIDPDYPMPTEDAADLTAWVSIKFDSINYKDVDLRPVFNLPDARPLMAYIVRAAENHVLTIVNS